MAEQMTMTATRTAGEQRWTQQCWAIAAAPPHHLASSWTGPVGNAVRLREVPFLDPDHDPRRLARGRAGGWAATLGTVLPRCQWVGVAHGDQAGAPRCHVVWVSPDEWLAVLGDEAGRGRRAPRWSGR